MREQATLTFVILALGILAVTALATVPAAAQTAAFADLGGLTATYAAPGTDIGPSPAAQGWATTVKREPMLSAAPREVRIPKPQLAARPALGLSPQPASRHALAGIASFYWQGTTTASGEPFDKTAMTAAHPSLPFGTKVRVHCKATGKDVVVRINDRGPFKPGRIIDLSEAAAEAIGMRSRGLTTVQLEVVQN